VKASVTLAIHHIDVLDGVRLGDLTSLLMSTYKQVPHVSGDEMSVVMATDKPIELIEAFEALTVTLAMRFSPFLWTSVVLQWSTLQP